MTRVLVIAGIVFVLVGVLIGWVAHASGATGCQGNSPLSLPCTHSFVATQQPQSFRVFKNDSVADTQWSVDVREFLTGYHPNACREFGRYGAVRVSENTCGGLVVTVRSVGAPAVVKFSWEVVSPR